MFIRISTLAIGIETTSQKTLEAIKMDSTVEDTRSSIIERDDFQDSFDFFYERHQDFFPKDLVL
jgi:hypothetical protein